MRTYLFIFLLIFFTCVYLQNSTNEKVSSLETRLTYVENQNIHLKQVQNILIQESDDNFSIINKNQEDVDDVLITHREAILETYGMIIETEKNRIKGEAIMIDKMMSGFNAFDFDLNHVKAKVRGLERRVDD